jgi:DNA-binding response OmpR family regulator
MSALKHILLIEDEPNVRLVFRTALEAEGYHVSEAADGAAGLAALGKAPVDLVLLDLKMPVIDGMETLRRLRGAGDETAVVIVSAHGSIPDTVAAMRLGAIDVIPKPVSPNTLREVVAQAIERSEAQRPGPRLAKHTGPLDSVLFDEDIARSRRALERQEFDDAEFYLRIAHALGPGSAEVLRLRDDLCTRRSKSRAFTYRNVGKMLS